MNSERPPQGPPAPEEGPERVPGTPTAPEDPSAKVHNLIERANEAFGEEHDRLLEEAMQSAYEIEDEETRRKAVEYIERFKDVIAPSGHKVPEEEIPTFIGREAPEKPDEKPSRIGEVGRKLGRLGEAFKAGARGAKEGWQEKAAERKAASVSVKERLIQKLETFRGGIEKGLEKFRSAKPAETRGEKRAELLKEWEKMTEDERREYYGRRFERAERLYAFEKARVNFLELEKEYNGLSWLDRKTYDLTEIEEEYEAAKIEYQSRRAELVGANAWLMLNERMRVAEQEATRHEKGWFEGGRKFWRWLGEQNLEKVFKPTNKVGKVVARMASLRTLASLGFLGGGMAVGFGSAVGLAALATRRVMSGASTAFGSYDLMSQVTEKRALAFNKEELAKMSQDEIDAKMAEFEARAKFSGERVVHNRDYDILRRQFVNRINSGSVEQQTILDAIDHIDKALREKKVEVAKGEKQRKIAAVGIGLFSIMAFSAGSIAKLLEGKPEFAGVTPEQIQDTIQRGPIVSPDTVKEAIETEPVVPDTVLQAADTTQFEVTDTTFVGPLQEAAGAPTEEFIGPLPETPAGTLPGAAEAPAVEVVTEVKAEVVGVVKKGGSAWQAVRELVTGGKITEEQFKELWSNPASTYTLESGRVVHISELGLTHAGDQVVVVPATETLPAHLEIIDYPDDVLHVGSNEDLAAAFDAAGRPRPEWLQQTLAVELSEYPEVKLDIVGPNRFEELMPVPQEIIEKAAAGGLEIKEEITNIEWGTAEFITDADGKVADIVIKESMSPLERIRLSKLAADTFLLPGFETTVQGDVQKIAQAQEAAWKVLQLSTVLERLVLEFRAGGIPEADFIRERIKSIVQVAEQALGKQVFIQDKVLRF